MAIESAFDGMPRMNERSIVSESTGKLRRWLIDEEPVPKSSIVMRTPRFLIALNTSAAASGLDMTVFSENSSSRYLGSMPDSANAVLILADAFFRWNCRADTLTATPIGGSPASCHALFWAHASRSTHSLMGTIRPVSTARGRNSSGNIKPSSGCRQRTSASAPSMAPVVTLTRG